MSLLQAGKDLVARGGVPELYQGLGVTLVGSMPAVGVYFGLYQFVKNQMDAREGVPSYISITVSAGVGNLIARYILYSLLSLGDFQPSSTDDPPQLDTR